LPLQLVWLSSVFLFFGGGPFVITAIGVTMISDVTPPEKQTTVFLYMTAAVLVAQSMAPILVAKLMANGDWFPLLLALAIQLVGITITLFLPKTLHLRDLQEPRNEGEDRRTVQGEQHKKSRFKEHVRHYQDAMAF
jgi:MFS family permease